MNLKYWNEVNGQLDSAAYQREPNLALMLIDNDITYINGNTTLDAVEGDTNKQIWATMNLQVLKMLKAKLKGVVQVDGDNNFTPHMSFKIKGANQATTLPYTLDFDDGQILTALVANKKNYENFNPTKGVEVTHWFLNKKDITKMVYPDGDKDIDINTLTTRLSTLTEGVHTKFVKQNPILSKVQQLKDEINAMEIDLSGVVSGVDVKPKITAENIAEYYPTMSDEELSELPASVFGTKFFNADMTGFTSSNVESNIFGARLRSITAKLSEATGIYVSSSSETQRYKLLRAKDRVVLSYEDDMKVYSNIGLIILGVRDTLKPIDQYIEEIKNSSKYQEYYTATKQKIMETTKAQAPIQEQSEKYTKAYKQIFDEKSNEEKANIDFLEKSYPTMSNEEKVKHIVVLDELFADRQILIMSNMEIEANKKDYITEQTIHGSKIPQHNGTIKLHDLIYEQTMFGVKDNLQPIDQYIEEIKNSPQYKEYIASKNANRIKELMEQDTPQYNFNLTATTSDEYEKKLDELANQIEQAGEMEQYEDKLNELADKLTEMMKKENE